MIKASPIPDNALLNNYVKEGTYTDCYVVAVSESISFAQYITAFYTTRIFKLERYILKLALAKPSTEVQAEQLANGSIENFAAWKVEARDKNQLLMCDISSRTRSWFMLESTENGTGTLLYFGSAVVPIKHPKSGKLTLGAGFKVLLGFHKLYSKVLLSAAKSQLHNAARLRN